MDVGTEVRKAREAKGWSQAKLAAGADMGVSGISQIETGTRNPSVTTLSKIAGALGVEVGELFPKGQASLLDFTGERRLSVVAHQLLMLGEHLLQTWEAELPERARSNDDEWLGNTAGTWHMLGEINLGVLEELGADRLHDKQKWLARYMDVNATVHRLNATIRAHSDSDMVPDELLFETLPTTA